MAEVQGPSRLQIDRHREPSLTGTAGEGLGEIDFDPAGPCVPVERSMRPASEIPLLSKASAFADRIAVIDQEGSHTYSALLDAAIRTASCLLGGRQADLGEERIAFCAPPGLSYVAAQWGIWMAGGVALPLFPGYPLAEIEYQLEDAQTRAVVCHPDFEAKLRPAADRLGIPLISTKEALRTSPARLLPVLGLERRAMILYTSGTTSRPKGVVLTHSNLSAQISSLVDAWEWRPEDHILHVLPLHHTHGIVNALCCALWSGARCEMMPRFDPKRVWDRFAQGGVSLFMAVPTMYVRLLAAWEQALPERRKILSRAAARLRLMVSGSAALPVNLFEKWREISGQALLERYGMTEIGMVLSNPLRGERRPGCVGTPLPGVEVRLTDEDGRPVTREGRPGEIEVRGPTVFLEYWRRPEATRAAFREGWFRTGDIAVLDRGSYRILGRSSVDILKTGGYKVSALEIEAVLSSHPAIQECAVVGVQDAEWGERVAAAVVLNPGFSLTLQELRSWAKERLAPYKVPTLLRCCEALPRNALGKVLKPEIKKTLGDEERPEKTPF